MCLHPLAQVYHTVIASHEQENSLPQAPNSVSQQHNGLQYAHDSGVVHRTFSLDTNLVLKDAWATSSPVTPGQANKPPPTPEAARTSILLPGRATLPLRRPNSTVLEAMATPPCVCWPQPGSITPRIETGSVWRASEKVESSDHHMLARAAPAAASKRLRGAVLPVAAFLPGYLRVEGRNNAIISLLITAQCCVAAGCLTRCTERVL